MLSFALADEYPDLQESDPASDHDEHMVSDHNDSDEDLKNTR